ALLDRAGVNTAGLRRAVEAAIKRLPQVQGAEQVQVGRDTVSLLQAAEKEALKRGDQFIASEMFLLALTDTKAEIGQIAKEHGLTRKALEAAIDAVRGGQRVENAEAEGQREALKKEKDDASKQRLADLERRRRAAEAEAAAIRARMAAPKKVLTAKKPEEEKPKAEAAK
ncbi:Clp protease N-terminal domain-containing protein, partial [Cutibacterium acnes]